MKEYVLAHVLFPCDEELFGYEELYLRSLSGPEGFLAEKGRLLIKAGSKLDFTTYLNGFSFLKWKKYTGLSGVKLGFCIKGEAEIELTGYSLIQNKIASASLEKHNVSSEALKEYELSYPQNESGILGFKIFAKHDTLIARACYVGLYEEKKRDRDIRLSISTTTFKKESFVRQNTKRIYEDLLKPYPEISANICMHIVDNGMTLKKEDIPEDTGFILHQNPNVGGAGGFARGMLESLYYPSASTHVLLMDDDVLILPESIFRTYQLLRLLNSSFHRHFISGAMFLYEKRNIQFEDVGYVSRSGECGPVKRKLDQTLLKNILENEEEMQAANMYQGWWYCCIPAAVIEDGGLPLPLFFRGDDVEFSLRNRAKFISMNGICLWHPGPADKENVSIFYHEVRNHFIAHAVSGVLGEWGVIDRFRRRFRTSLLKYDYSMAEVVLKAFEDYLKGPQFLMTHIGKEVLKELSEFTEDMIPFNELPEEIKSIVNEALGQEQMEDIKRSRIKKLLYRITYNGQLFMPQRGEEKKLVAVPAGKYLPGRVGLKSAYVAFNGEDRKACIRRIDKDKFFVLQKRFWQDILYYLKNRRKIEESYRRRRDILVSKRFWRGYLHRAYGIRKETL